MVETCAGAVKSTLLATQLDLFKHLNIGSGSRPANHRKNSTCVFLVQWGWTEEKAEVCFTIRLHIQLGEDAQACRVSDNTSGIIIESDRISLR